MSDGEPDPAFAASVVHGQRYSQLEAQLSHAMVELISAMDQRTRDRVEAAQSAIRRWQWLLAATAIRLYPDQPGAGADPRSGAQSRSGRWSATPHGWPPAIILARLADLRGVDELLTLGMAFDSMARRSKTISVAGADAARARRCRPPGQRAPPKPSHFFTASMSHEIRTPLNGVIGMLRFALRDEQLSTKTRHKVRLALSSSESLLTIINDIPGFSKIEAGKLTLEQADFECRAMLQTTRWQLWPSWRRPRGSTF